MTNIYIYIPYILFYTGSQHLDSTEPECQTIRAYNYNAISPKAMHF